MGFPRGDHKVDKIDVSVLKTPCCDTDLRDSGSLGSTRGGPGILQPRGTGVVEDATKVSMTLGGSGRERDGRK